MSGAIQKLKKIQNNTKNPFKKKLKKKKSKMFKKSKNVEKCSKNQKILKNLKKSKKKKKNCPKKCYPSSFPILGGRNWTRALQSRPFKNPGGVVGT